VNGFRSEGHGFRQKIQQDTRNSLIYKEILTCVQWNGSKLLRLPTGEPNSSTAERIIQWCNSSRFKPARINSSGGRWVGWHMKPVD
jgi:hypothetical protein